MQAPGSAATAVFKSEQYKQDKQDKPDKQDRQDRQDKRDKQYKQDRDRPIDRCGRRRAEILNPVQGR